MGKDKDIIEESLVNTDNKNYVIGDLSVGETSKELDPEVRKQLVEIAGDINNVSSADANNQTIISDEIVKEKLEQVATASTPKKKLKSTITSLILLAVNIFLVFSLAKNLLGSADDSTLDGLISVQGARLNFLWWGILLFVLIIVADSLLIAVILKTTTRKFKPALSYKASSIGKYYEAITPFSAGGQPAQIVYLSKGGVSPGIATSIPIIRVTLINFITVCIGIVLFAFHTPNITGGNGFIDILIGLLEILAYIGLILNTLYFIAIFIIANSKVVGRTLARTIVKVGYKLKIFKDYRVAYKKIINQVTEYRNSVDYLKKHIWTLMLSVFLVLIEVLALASIPFVVTIALTDISFAGFSAFAGFWVECLIKYYICYFASAYIPLPGGTGMMEVAFVILFSSIIGPNFVAWGFLIWRLISYYSTIIQGFIITLFDVFKNMFTKTKNIKS